MKHKMFLRRSDGKKRKKSAGGPGKAAQSSVPTPHQQLLELQSVIGNQAMQRHLEQGTLQRMPMYSQIVGALGKPKFRSSKYKAVLKAVNAFNNFINQTAIGTTQGEVKGQMQQVMTLANQVITAANGYSGEKGAKADYMVGLKASAQQDMSAASQLMLKFATNPGLFWMKPKLYIALSNAGTKALQLDEKNIVGKDKGGTSEVTKFKQGGKEGYFKADKETLFSPKSGQDLDEAVDEATSDITDRGEKQQKMAALQNEYYLGVGDVGIDAANARMANRDVAMSRLDQLLGADVVAKAELATRKLPSGSVKGSFMEAAKGTSGKQMIKEGKLAASEKGQSKQKPGAVSKDPNLMRLLSRLQLIDLLSVQIDRNPANYYIVTDNSGKVIAITGIDNDFALGTQKNIKARKQELPGISRYVDEDLALRIIDLDLDLLRIVMADLLSEDEIEALIARFEELRKVLKELKDQGKLLKPNQWNDGVAKGLLEEGKSYYANITSWEFKING